MNKIATDKTLSVYWFFILFITAAGISYIVISFYGKPYDVRSVEASALTNKISDCISQNGYIKNEALNANFVNDFEKKCALNFNVEDTFGWKQQGQYYSLIEISDFKSGEKKNSFNIGNQNLKKFCGFEGKQIPVCIVRNFYAIDKDNKQYKIKISSAIGKIEKNAP